MTYPNSVSNWPRVTVLILNFNGKKYLEKFLPSVIQTDYPDFEILVADNASTDDSIAFCQQQYPDVKLVKFSKNFGFAEGNNQAIPFVETELLVLLNSDVEVDKNWLKPMVSRMLSSDKIAAVQPKIRMFDDKKLFEYAGAAGGYVDYLAFPLCRGRVFQTVEEDHNQYDDSKEVFWATGACMLLRKSIIEKIGLFDSRFFAHMEEIDFCWRAKNAGYQIWVEPSAVVFHVGGGTLPKGNPKKDFLNLRNSLVMMSKNLHSSEWFSKIFLRLCVDGIAAFRQLFTGQPIWIWIVLKAHLSFYLWLPQTLKLRKKITQQKKLNEHIGVIPKFMLFQYFIKKKRKFTELN